MDTVQVTSKMSVKQHKSKQYMKYFKSPDYHEPVEGEEPVQPRELTSTDFKEIMARRKPSVSTEMIRAYHKWSEEFQAL